MTKFTQLFEPEVDSKIPKEMLEMKQIPTDIEAKKSLQINNTLPGEILYLIFRRLIPAVTFPQPDYNPEDWLHLKTTRKVCRLWREVTEAPSLWKKIRVKVNWRNTFAMQRLLTTWRMRDVQKIQISDEGAVSEELRKVVVKHQGLRQITFSCRHMFSVAPRLLAQLVHSLEEVRMTDTPLTRRQVDDIFVGLTGETKLTGLSILKADLSSVDPCLLARARDC